MTTMPSKPLPSDTITGDAPASIGREYELDHGPASEEAGKKIADLLALPNSEDVELDIDRTPELPRGADLS